MKIIKCSCGTDILLDSDCPAWVFETKWGCSGRGSVHYWNTALARTLMGNSENLTIDHIDRNIHNNQLNNLRWVTKRQNTLNRGPLKRNVTGYKGVSFDKRQAKPFRAYICVNEQRRYLGSFNTPEEAATKYNEVAIVEFGEHAFLNTIP